MGSGDGVHKGSVRRWGPQGVCPEMGSTGGPEMGSGDGVRRWGPEMGSTRGPSGDGVHRGSGDGVRRWDPEMGSGEGSGDKVHRGTDRAVGSRLTGAADG
eukprot:1180366-Prorocentrum_minimum.AAC.1